MRKKNQDKNVRYMKVRKTNLAAENLVELVNWEEEDINEPDLKCFLKQEDIKFQDPPILISQITVNGQSIERIVKEVTRAAKAVFGFERREGYVRATMGHRDILPVSHSIIDL